MFFALHFYIRDAVIRKHENCTTKMQIKETTLFIEQIESNLDISNWYRRETFQNVNRSKFQITMSRLSARVASRRFNSVERDRDYSFMLSEANRKLQISIRLFRVEQVTQKWRSFVARFSSVLRHKKSLSSKRKNEIICYNYDKQNHVRSECLISLNKIDFKYAKKNRDL